MFISSLSRRGYCFSRKNVRIRQSPANRWKSCGYRLVSAPRFDLDKYYLNFIRNLPKDGLITLTLGLGDQTRILPTCHSRSNSYRSSFALQQSPLVQVALRRASQRLAILTTCYRTTSNGKPRNMMASDASPSPKLNACIG